MYFNSSKVRYKHYMDLEYFAEQYRFQFLQGTVQTDILNASLSSLNNDFNSSKVRYKPNQRRSNEERRVNFNSSKVRYKQIETCQ